jgi:hypothetical protein
MTGTTSAAPRLRTRSVARGGGGRVGSAFCLRCSGLVKLWWDPATQLTGAVQRSDHASLTPSLLHTPAGKQVGGCPRPLYTDAAGLRSRPAGGARAACVRHWTGGRFRYPASASSTCTTPSPTASSATARATAHGGCFANALCGCSTGVLSAEVPLLSKVLKALRPGHDAITQHV